MHMEEINTKYADMKRVHGCITSEWEENRQLAALFRNQGITGETTNRGCRFAPCEGEAARTILLPLRKNGHLQWPWLVQA